MKELISLVKDLLSKIQSDSATLIDYLNTIDAVIHFLKDVLGPSVIGDGEADQEDVEQVLGICSAVGLEVPKTGPVLSIALQLLLKYLLEQFLKDN